MTLLLRAMSEQFCSKRSLLLSEPDGGHVLQTLSSLQDRLPSFPTSIAMSVIEEELKRPVGEVYLELSPEPVAAASLGQV